jgi:pimeloyl-ACP methyl ester carboxylesterase
VEGVFPGPYLAWYPLIPTADELESTREEVRRVIEDEGPFDGLIGFSQGAALAASLILQHSAESNPLVKCAIFFSGALPWLLSSELKSLHRRYSEFECKEIAAFVPERMKVLLAHYGHATFPGYTLDEEQALWLHPATTPLRFPVPTVFIHGGRKDYGIDQALALIGLGDEKTGVRVLNHEMGHTVPRDDYITNEMTEMIAWAKERVSYYL